MISILDIFYALAKEFEKCTKVQKHYFGMIPENYKAPAFLYLLVFNGDTRRSYLNKNVSVDIQVVYFGKKDNDGVVDFEEKIKVCENLKGVLSKFNLWVKDRNLKFAYDITEADKQLSINIKFEFIDELINPEFDEQQSMEYAEEIMINDEVI